LRTPQHTPSHTPLGTHLSSLGTLTDPRPNIRALAHSLTRTQPPHPPLPTPRYYSQTRSVSLVPFSAVTGTLGYIAPEILNHSMYDTAVDMWSLGVLLFQVWYCAAAATESARPTHPLCPLRCGKGTNSRVTGVETAPDMFFFFDRQRSGVGDAWAN
jgi:serine/threonine protein kinase